MKNIERSVTRRQKVVGLFGGIGGLELGFERTDKFETVLFSEYDSAASRVLETHFPRVPNIGDIRELDALPTDVDVVTAGFPCQDLSQAGETKGIRGRESGLVQEVFRLLNDRPASWVVLENVPFMLQLKGGAGIRFIVENLERLSYRWAYRVVDSRAFGLPHRRQRVFLVASSERDPAPLLFNDEAGPVTEEKDRNGHACGFYWTEGVRGLGWAVNAIPTLKGGSTVGIPSAPAIWLPYGDVVTPNIEAAERLQGFSSGWTEPAESVKRKGHRWKLVGNAVTVDVAEWVATCISRRAESEVLKALPVPLGNSWPKAAYGSGEGRYEVAISPWPVSRPIQSLGRVLGNDRKLLSERATRGFLNRFEKSSLRKPEGLISALQDHLERVRANSNA